MSRILINRYFAELDRTKKFSGSLIEEVIREAFKGLLKDWSRDQNLFLQVQYVIQGPAKNIIKLDGAALHDLRVPLGYWEAKDTADDLDREIETKLRKGYPQDNIIFENSDLAVLIQNRIEVMRCAMTDAEQPGRLLDLFFRYERPEIAEFRKTVGQFSSDLPAILERLSDNLCDSVEALQADLDAWLVHHNTERPHLGYRNMGRRPADTVMAFVSQEG